VQESEYIKMPSVGFAFLFAVCTSICNGAFVLDQIGIVGLYDFDTGADPTPSQVYTDFPDFSSAVLEDFTVTSSQLEITNVSGLFRAQGGFDKFTLVSGYALNIFSDPTLAANSLSGDVASLFVIAGSGASVTEVEGGAIYEFGLVSLDVSIALPQADDYWVSISPVSAFSVSGQFLLLNNGASGAVTPGGANARLANPGEGFGLGALSIVNQDYAYSLTAVPEPTIASLAIVSSLALVSRRKRRHPPEKKP
jgi:hypothetical protein